MGAAAAPRNLNVRLPCWVTRAVPSAPSPKTRALESAMELLDFILLLGFTGVYYASCQFLPAVEE